MEKIHLFMDILRCFRGITLQWRRTHQTGICTKRVWKWYLINDSHSRKFGCYTQISRFVSEIWIELEKFWWVDILKKRVCGRKKLVRYKIRISSFYRVLRSACVQKVNYSKVISTWKYNYEKWKDVVSSTKNIWSFLLQILPLGYK